MAKARYKTKQMTELHTFLRSVQGQHVTVQEIREYFKDREIAVGTITIYRQLEKMVKEGLVEKYVVEGTNSACFEYIGESETSDYESCYHCKCEIRTLMRKEKDMTTEKRKHLAAWFSIIFIFVTLASLFYIVKEENHKCTGEDCPVCACV